MGQDAQGCWGQETPTSLRVSVTSVLPYEWLHSTAEPKTPVHPLGAEQGGQRENVAFGVSF